MQSTSRAGSDFFSESGCPIASPQSYRDTGHMSMHTPSPVHTSQSTATLVPCMPCFVGGSRGPQTLCPLCSPATCRFFWKSGSIGKKVHLPIFREKLNISVSEFKLQARRCCFRKIFRLTILVISRELHG